MTEIIIGLKESDHILMNVGSFLTNDRDGWVGVAVELRSGPFVGSYNASMMKVEFVEFHKQVMALYRELKGVANFSTIEGQLEYSMVGNGRGLIKVSGHGFGSSGGNSKLTFDFDIDQTYLIGVIDGLKLVLL